MKFVLFALILLLVVSGAYFIYGQNSGRMTAIEKCIELCENFEGNRTNGPCLSNEVISDWVCDIAHSPRRWVDNKKENQCPAYGVNASHFVELDENCSLIRAI